jgi:hypothetical protein
MVVHDGDIKLSPLWGEQSPYAGRIISALVIIYDSEQMDCDFINCLFLYSDLLNLTGGRTKWGKQRNGLSFVSRGVTVCSRPKQNSQNRDVKPVFFTWQLQWVCEPADLLCYITHTSYRSSLHIKQVVHRFAVLLCVRREIICVAVCKKHSTFCRHYLMKVCVHRILQWPVLSQAPLLSLLHYVVFCF